MKARRSAAHGVARMFALAAGLWLPSLAVADETQAILFYGQSNAGAGGHDTPVLLAPVAPERIASFRGSRQTYGNAEVAPARLAGLGPIQDVAKYAPFPATAMAAALAATSPPTQRFFLHTVWYGGQPLGAFVPGTPAFADLKIVAERFRAVLAERGRQGHVAALVWLQGESGPSGREDYAAALGGLLDAALPALTAPGEQPPLAILLQTNMSNAQLLAANGAELGQWDLARRRPDTILAGPLYQFPLADTVHQSTLGRLMLGDLLALVYRQSVLEGRRFQPLQPKALHRDGRRITIAFERPADSRPLAWDTDFVPPAPDFGFAYSDDDRSARIEQVAITGPSQVTITLDHVPTGTGRRLAYAMGQPRLPGWAPGRGQLIAPTDQASAFASVRPGERPVPAHVAHYAVRFVLDVP